MRLIVYSPVYRQSVSQGTGENCRLNADVEPLADFFEARAILLGRLGKHEAALDIYVNRLNDPSAAEKLVRAAGLLCRP